MSIKVKRGWQHNLSQKLAGWQIKTLIGDAITVIVGLIISTSIYLSGWLQSFIGFLLPGFQGRQKPISKWFIRPFKERWLVKYLSPRWILWGIAGFLLGSIIHILIILFVPQAIPFSLYDSVAKFGPNRQFNILPPVLARSEPLLDLDPSMQHALCRFNLENGPLKVIGDIPSPFWSLVYFNSKGQVVYSLNNSSASDQALSLLVLTTEQLSVLRENPPAELENMIVQETTDPKGFVMIRAFIPSKAHLPSIKTGLTSAQCQVELGAQL